MPRIAGLLETALYVSDMAVAKAFFIEVLGLKPMLSTERLTAFDAGRQGVLLLFLEGASAEDMPGPNGCVPGHDGSGPVHMAFAIETEDYDKWKDRLAQRNIPLRGEMAWPRGGHSLYFDDPDGHLIELATPGLWPNY
ncbi:lactoylglutathione lyase [Aliidongia dinghuensis]|uniref:Lactoylglutathione lyase n=1 Tax=Aliidongia dinghuensis TaxID=1867774 RepID=A0A8J2YS67_9PROT|nr:VOC family protein [Aliidongia dinghuensis]GGF09009.1 lactoylglutathione lyase [Aliidongia dinghuensis]